MSRRAVRAAAHRGGARDCSTRHSPTSQDSCTSAQNTREAGEPPAFSALIEIASSHGATAVQVALGCVHHRQHVHSVPVPDSWNDGRQPTTSNIAAAQPEPSDDELRRLDYPQQVQRDITAAHSLCHLAQRRLLSRRLWRPSQVLETRNAEENATPAAAPESTQPGAILARQSSKGRVQPRRPPTHHHQSLMANVTRPGVSSRTHVSSIRILGDARDRHQPSDALAEGPRHPDESFSRPLRF